MRRANIRKATSKAGGLPCRAADVPGAMFLGEDKVGDDMSLYKSYLDEIETRQLQGLKPKPIDNGDLVAELIAQIRDTGHEHRAASLDFLIYNTLPGTTSAAGVKAAFLKDIVLGAVVVPEITRAFARFANAMLVEA